MKILVNQMPDFPKQCPYSIKFKEKDAKDYTYFCGWKGCNHKRHKCTLTEWSYECKYFKEHKG